MEFECNSHLFQLREVAAAGADIKTEAGASEIGSRESEIAAETSQTGSGRNATRLSRQF